MFYGWPKVQEMKSKKRIDWFEYCIVLKFFGIVTEHNEPVETKLKKEQRQQEYCVSVKENLLELHASGDFLARRSICV